MGLESMVLSLGMIASAGLIVMILWSIYAPEHRLWPLEEITALNQALIWGATILAFASAFVLGVLDWNGLGWPASVRWGLGGGLVIAGNVVVWTAVFGIGWTATSGAPDVLKTNGFYRYSRNPQYLADIGILLGWAILSASVAALPVVFLGTLVLVLAPIAEEPWLAKTYGAEYTDYRSRVPRFL